MWSRCRHQYVIHIQCTNQHTTPSVSCAYSATASGYFLITPTATPTFPPTRSGSCVWTHYDMIEFYTYFPPGAVPESDLIFTTRSPPPQPDSCKPAEYAVPITLTAPASCPTSFTFTFTTINNYIQDFIHPQMTYAGLLTPMATITTHRRLTWRTLCSMLLKFSCTIQLTSPLRGMSRPVTPPTNCNGSL